MTPPRVLIITVNYNGARSTERFLRSAASLARFADAHVIVVENGSSDNSSSILRGAISGLAHVELLESAENRGYFRAADWALRQYRERGNNPDWIIVCNNDITFDDSNFLSNLLGHDPEAAHVIAPAIMAMPANIDCNPFLKVRPSTSQLLRYRFWHSNYYLMWVKQCLSPYVRSMRHHARFRSARSPKGKNPIYAPHGAFLIFSRAYFERGGYIDDGFFLYAEEFSVAEICRTLGLSIIHDSELRVWHQAHNATGRMCNRQTFEWGRSGFEYVWRTYFSSRAGSNPAERRLTRAATLVERRKRGEAFE